MPREAGHFVPEEVLEESEKSEHLPSEEDIGHYARRHQNEPGWKEAPKAFEHLGVVGALPFFEKEVVRARATERTDVRELRSFVYAMDTKINEGRAPMERARLVRLLERYRDTHLNELGVQGQGDLKKEVRADWDNTIREFQSHGSIEAGLAAFEDHINELDKKLDDFNTRKVRVSPETYTDLNQARAARATLLGEYFDRGKVH